MRRVPALRWVLASLVAAAVAAFAVVAISPASGARVEVTERPERGQPSRCADVEVDGTRAAGGCVLRAGAAATSFTVLTPFGDHRLARCRVRYLVRLGPSGEVAVADVRVEDLAGARGLTARFSAACGDIRACTRPWTDLTGSPGLRDQLPWTGELSVAGGRAVAAIGVCFDTCMGRFEGSLSLRLAERGDGRWLVSGDRALAGESGLEISGDWHLDPSAGERVAIEAPAA